MRLIDADALPKYTGYALSAAEVAKAVENAPTIDAEPVRRGRWDTLSVNDIAGRKHTRYVCSLCGIQLREPYNYCPNCGEKKEDTK